MLKYLRLYKYFFSRSLGIPKNMVFTGDFTSAGSGTVHGKILGNIQLDGTLVIGREASVSGTVRAAKIVVLGTVTGELYGTQKIIVEAGGRIAGKMDAPEIKIYPEGVVDTAGPQVAVVEEADKDPQITGIVMPTRPKSSVKTWF